MYTAPDAAYEYFFHTPHLKKYNKLQVSGTALCYDRKVILGLILASEGVNFPKQFSHLQYCGSCGHYLPSQESIRL